MKLAATLYAGTEPLAPKSMKDREIFDFLGYE
jgi:light-independent protochlorophyllide reductase subunit L